MRKILMTIALMGVVMPSLWAQSKINDKMSVYQLPNSKLHVYQTGDAMGDVSFIIEGEKRIVILEQPLFWDNIDEFNTYIESLNKPIDKVVANYHSLGLADYKLNSVVMPEKMIEFGKSPMAMNMVKNFQDKFGDAADFRPHRRAKGFSVPSLQDWAGVKFEFTSGIKSAFPGANILIDGEVFYRHFSPAISHFNPMQIKSPESIEATLSDLKLVKESGAKYIFGSHGVAATQKEVTFQIEYLERIKALMSKCKDADSFAQQLILSYPTLSGAENVKAIARSLYANVAPDSEKEAIRARVQDYFNMVSNLDKNIAQDLWAKRDDVSIITPRSHFVGVESIMNDFLFKTFSSMKSRRLHSLNEVINVYGDSANVQLYWIFDTVDTQDQKHQTRGRESLMFTKINGEWQLTHVHYSRMPQ